MGITAVVVFSAIGAAAGAMTSVRAIRGEKSGTHSVALWSAATIALGGIMILQRVVGLMRNFLVLLMLPALSACQNPATVQSAGSSRTVVPEAKITKLSGWTTQQTADAASFISIAQAGRPVVSISNDDALRHIEIHGADSPKGVTVTTTLAGQMKEITIQAGDSTYKVQSSGDTVELVGPTL